MNTIVIITERETQLSNMLSTTTEVLNMVSAERDELRAAVNVLLRQIDIGDFVDSHGHSAKMLQPVHKLMKLLSEDPRAAA